MPVYFFKGFKYNEIRGALESLSNIKNLLKDDPDSIKAVNYLKKELEKKLSKELL